MKPCLGAGRGGTRGGALHALPTSAPSWETVSAVHLEMRSSDNSSMRFPNDWEKCRARHPVSNPQGQTVRGNGAPLDPGRPTVPTHILGTLLASAGIVLQ